MILNRHQNKNRFLFSHQKLVFKSGFHSQYNWFTNSEQIHFLALIAKKNLGSFKALEVANKSWTPGAWSIYNTWVDRKVVIVSVISPFRLV